MGIRTLAVVLIALSAPALAQEPPKAPPAPPKEEAKPPPEKPVIEIEKSTKPPECVIKPVMTDEELRACGARIAK
jgi:hypothetical protein